MRSGVFASSSGAWCKLASLIECVNLSLSLMVHCLQAQAPRAMRVQRLVCVAAVSSKFAFCTVAGDNRCRSAV